MVEVSALTPAGREASRRRQTNHGRSQAEIVTLQVGGADIVENDDRHSTRTTQAAGVFEKGIALEKGRSRESEDLNIAVQCDEPGVKTTASLANKSSRSRKREVPLAPQIATLIDRLEVGEVAVLQRSDQVDIGPRDLKMPPGAKADWRFYPVWDARREAVSIYFAVPHDAKTGERLRGYQFEDSSVSPPSFLDLDIEAVKISERSLSRLHEQRKHALVGISVHASSLATQRGRALLFAALDGCNPNLAVHRLIRIAGISACFPLHSLRPIIDLLRARVPKIVIAAAWHEPDVTGLVQCGGTAFGFAYPDQTAAALSVVANGTLWSRFSAGVETAHIEGLPVYVEGAISKLLVRRFQAAGADYICSPEIWTPRQEPDGAESWPLGRPSS